MCDIKSIVGSTGGCENNNPPGLRTKLYLCPVAEMTGQPKTEAEIKILASQTPAQGDTMIIGEEFPMSASTGLGYFREFDILTSSGAVTDTLEGEIGGRAFSTSIEFEIAGSNAVKREFANNMRNKPVVAIIAAKNGDRLVVGRYDDPARAETIELATGKAPGDKHGATYKLTAATGNPAMVYKSSLVIDVSPS